MSQRVDILADRNETRDALDHRLIMFLLSAGFIAIPVPNMVPTSVVPQHAEEDALRLWLNAIQPDAILLSGGNDIGESYARDHTESSLLYYSQLHKLPVLGVCRGMQMMAHWFGAVLHPVSQHVRTRHHLYGIIEGEVNSYHKCSIVACPDDFDVLARSKDGEIEAIRHNTLPWEGWMWHPEREKNFHIKDINRIQSLFN